MRTTSTATWPRYRRRLLLGCWLFLVCAATAATSTAAETARRWNVLFLMADDWRPEIGCYGTPGMRTPNVDKLAAGGVRFARDYCQFPVCNPSRVSLLTGRYPNVTKVVFNGTHLRDLHPDWVTLPECFKNHGYHNGEKGRWGKTTVFEIALRVPLVIRLPGAAGNGRACSRTVQSLDLYPTLAELCGLPRPDGLQGHSLAPLLRDPEAAWPHAAFSMAKTGGGPIGYSVRTDRWHYAQWKGGEDGSLLFDVAEDPHETRNLAGDPRQESTVAEMKKLLEAAFGDMPFRIPVSARTGTVSPPRAKPNREDG